MVDSYCKPDAVNNDAWLVNTGKKNYLFDARKDKDYGHLKTILTEYFGVGETPFVLDTASPGGYPDWIQQAFIYTGVYKDASEMVEHVLDSCSSKYKSNFKGLCLFETCDNGKKFLFMRLMFSGGYSFCYQIFKLTENGSERAKKLNFSDYAYAGGSVRYLVNAGYVL